jgi:hypothetical protein
LRPPTDRERSEALLRALTRAHVAQEAIEMAQAIPVPDPVFEATEAALVELRKLEDVIDTVRAELESGSRRAKTEIEH